MPSFGHLLPPPPSVRRGVPLYYAKSEEEVRQDVYERFDALVTRQTALHLADELYGYYPFQPLLDYCLARLPRGESLAVADIGCSVGRLAGEVARRHPTWDCYGIDYSYQMLRQAREYWQLGGEITVNLVRFGYGTHRTRGTATENLSFALAKAGNLPLPAASLDVLLSTFLIDRIDNPPAAFAEWWRVLRPGGRLVIVSPLNFLRADNWERFYPPIKLAESLRGAGWEVSDWTDPLAADEPLDRHGNLVRWKCVAFTLDKP